MPRQHIQSYQHKTMIVRHWKVNHMKSPIGLGSTVTSAPSCLPAVYLLIDGISKAAIGMGLLLEQAARTIERRSPQVLCRSDRLAITQFHPPAVIDEITA